MIITASGFSPASNKADKISSELKGKIVAARRADRPSPQTPIQIIAP